MCSTAGVGRRLHETRLHGCCVHKQQCHQQLVALLDQLKLREKRVVDKRSGHQGVSAHCEAYHPHGTATCMTAYRCHCSRMFLLYVSPAAFQHLGSRRARTHTQSVKRGQDDTADATCAVSCRGSQRASAGAARTSKSTASSESRPSVSPLMRPLKRTSALHRKLYPTTCEGDRCAALLESELNVMQ